MKKTAPQEQGAEENGVNCWKGEPGQIGVADPDYQFKTEPLSPEDLAELLEGMQESMRLVLPPMLAGESCQREELPPKHPDGGRRSVGVDSQDIDSSCGHSNQPPIPYEQ